MIYIFIFKQFKMKPEEEVQPQAEKPEEEQQEEVAEPAPSSSLPSKYKIVFLGDTFVGKTCLINRFMYDTFNENYQVSMKIINKSGDHWY